MAEKRPTRKSWSFFNEIRLRRVKFGFAKWNSFIVKYLLRKCEEANFISHCDRREQYFTMCVSTLFHIRQRRIFHLKNECLYVIIISTNNFQKLFLQKQKKVRGSLQVAWLQTKMIMRCGRHTENNVVKRIICNETKDKDFLRRLSIRNGKELRIPIWGSQWTIQLGKWIAHFRCKPSGTYRLSNRQIRHSDRLKSS